MSDGKVIIETGLDDSGLQAGLKKLGIVAKAGLGITTKAIAGVGAALTGAAGLAVKSGIGFESAFAGVKKTVDASDQELAQFRQGIRDMAKEMPTSANEIAGVAEAAGQLGIKNKSLLSFTKTMVMLGDSTDMSADEAATSLARLANITGMPQENFDRLGATVVDLGNNLATTESEIVAMSMRIAGAGSQVGMSEAQIMSFSGALSSVGIEAEAGGTAFSTLLSKMNLASSKGGKELEQFGKVAGMSGEEFKKAFQEDASSAVISFIQGLGKINENGGSAIKTLDDMGLSDIRMRDALLRASGASDVFTEALQIGNDAWDENTALTNEAKQRYETLESKLSILKNTATDLGISLYDSLENPLRGVVDTATDMVGSLEKAFKKDGFDGLAEQAGTVLADAAVNIAEAAPSMIKAGSKTVKSFATGIAKNKKEIINAGGELVEALADGVGDLLPKDLGSAFKGVAEAAVNVAKPVLKVADAIATVTAKCSGAIPIIAGVGAAFKVSSFMDNFVSALKLIKVGQEATTKSAIANTLATKLNTATSKTASVSKIYQAAVEKSLAAATTMLTLKTDTYTVAQQASAAASGVAAVAAKGVSVALSMMGGPVGLAITAVGVLAGAFLTTAGNSDKATSAAERQAKKVKELSDAYDESKKSRQESFESSESEAEVATDLTQKISELAKKTHKTADEKARLKSCVSQLNELMPDLNLKYDEEKDKLNKSTEAIWNNVAAMQAAVEAKAAEANAIEAATEKKKIEKELNDAENSRDEAQKKLDTTDKTTIGADGLMTENPLYVSRKEALAEEQKNVDTLKGKYKEAKEELDYWNNTSVDATKWEAAMKSTKSFVALMRENGLNISKKLAEGIRSGQYGVVKSIEDVQNVATFSKLSKKAGKGGKDAVNALTKKLKAGKLSPAKAVDEMQKLIKFNYLYEHSGKAGKKTLQKLKDGIDSGKTMPSKAMAIVMEATLDKAKRKSKESKAIGQEIDSGAAGGLGTALISKAASWAESALAAAKKKLGIKSPSKRFRREVGRMMVAGVVQGIKDEKSKLISSVTSLMGSTISKAKKVAGNFESIGTSFTDSYTSKVNARQDAQIKAFENYVDKKQDSIKKADEKEERALQKKIDKSSGSRKKSYQRQLKSLKKKHKDEQAATKKAASKMISAYTSAIKAESKKLVAQAEKNIEAVSKKYQEKYDALIQKRDAMKEKLMDVGSLITTKAGSLSGLNAVNGASPTAALDRNIKALEKYQKNLNNIKGKIPDDLMEEILKLGVTDANTYMTKLLKMEDDKFADYVNKWKTEQATIKGLENQYLNKSTLGNLNDDIKKMKEYQAEITKLKGKKIPQSMMEEVLGMGIEDANTYMAQLNALSNSEFNTYVSQWKQKEALANSISKGFFAADIKSLQISYSKAINTEMSKLKTQMNNLGKNVGKAFTAGLKSQTKNMSKVVKDICNKLIKDVKKKLKIKSPSRVFRDIGKMSIQGAEVGTKKEAKKLYKSTEQVAQTYADRFAAANLDVNAIYRRMQAAVIAEQSRIPASVQTQIVKMQSQPDSKATPQTIEVHIHTDLNGREIAHEIARFTDKELGLIQERKNRGL